jgi:fatty-acyl-CoA synthase
VKDLWSIFARAEALWPNKEAVVDGERRLTYGEVGSRVRGLAAYLQGQGLRPGDRVAILEVNSHAYLEAYFAAAAAGAVLVPLNYRLNADELAFILRDAGARWLLSRGGFASLARQAAAGADVESLIWIGEGQAEERGELGYEAAIQAGASAPLVPVDPESDQAAQLYYTSGTTGRPKGVILTQANVSLHALGTIAELGLAESDVWGHIAPMFHLADAWATFAITLVGGRHVMIPSFNVEPVLAAIEAEGITLSNLIPTMLNLMLNHPRVGRYCTDSLRMLLSGGAPIAPELVRRIVEVFGCEYVQTYGMTETSPYLTLSLLKEHLRALPPSQQLAYRAKTGRPFVTVELKVVDAQGQPVRADGEQVGEILARGPTVTPGYWNLPDQTREAFRDGWLCTGDLATVDAEGYLDIVDRRKDMIISGGENIYSIEVENALYQHSAVLEAAVFGLPDETWGEVVHAAVVLRPEQRASEEALIAHCKQLLASFKAPRGISFLTELPKTGSGKICKRVLRGEVASCCED